MYSEDQNFNLAPILTEKTIFVQALIIRPTKKNSQASFDQFTESRPDSVAQKFDIQGTALFLKLETAHERMSVALKKAAAPQIGFLRDAVKFKPGLNDKNLSIKFQKPLNSFRFFLARSPISPKGNISRVCLKHSMAFRVSPRWRYSSPRLTRAGTKYSLFFNIFL